MDSFFYLNNRKSESGKAVKLSLTGYYKIYELNNYGVLKTIYDCDSNNNIASGYTIYLSSNGNSINQIINQDGETIVLKNGFLEGIYYYKKGLLNGFKISFKSKGNIKRLLKEFTIMKDSKPFQEPLQFKTDETIK
jgi:hypothetical protein